RRDMRPVLYADAKSGLAGVRRFDAARAASIALAAPESCGFGTTAVNFRACGAENRAYLSSRGHDERSHGEDHLSGIGCRLLHHHEAAAKRRGMGRASRQ